MVTTEKTKQALGITSTKYDDQINALIPLIYDAIKERRNISQVPNEHDDTVIQIIGYRLYKKVGAVSESISRLSTSYDEDFEEKQINKVARRLRW